MPKKTLALISGLVLVTFILFVIALKSSKKAPPLPPPPPIENETQSTSVDAMNSMKKSVLTLSPNPISIIAGDNGIAYVSLENSGNEVTAVQLEIAYDPNMISNVKVTPGNLFTTPVVLIDRNTIKEGRYTYAFGIMPNHSPVMTSGIVAQISFKAMNKPGKASQLGLLPTSLVTARGISESVLKMASNTLVEIK